MNEVKKNQTEKKSVFNKWFYIGLAITFAVLCIVCTVIFLYEFYVIRVVENALGEKVLTGHNLMNMLSDLFMIPSLITLLLYAIMYVSKEGAFDAIAYSTKLVFYTIFAKNTRHTKLPATYGEYRAMKMAKERSSTLFLLFAVIPFFICGLVFTILAACNYVPFDAIIVK